VSVGEYDEYVWVRSSANNSWVRFESYKEVSTEITETTTLPRRKEFNSLVNNVVYSRLKGVFPGTNINYTAHKCIIELEKATLSPIKYEYIVGRSLKNGLPNRDYCSEVQTFTLHPSDWTPIVYQTTD
jgi:hypothetical protein